MCCKSEVIYKNGILKPLEPLSDMPDADKNFGY